MIEMDKATARKVIIDHVAQHGPYALLSDRARAEQEAFRRRLQAIMDGPIPNAPHNHGALLREYDAGPSH